jgi:hypothetical protein
MAPLNDKKSSKNYLQILLLLIVKENIVSIIIFEFNGEKNAL